jgi:hypothetical protein
MAAALIMSHRYGSRMGGEPVKFVLAVALMLA